MKKSRQNPESLPSMQSVNNALTYSTELSKYTRQFLIILIIIFRHSKPEICWLALRKHWANRCQKSEYDQNIPELQITDITTLAVK